MIDQRKHIISHSQNLGAALKMLNDLGEDLTLFVVDDDERLIGTLTDGDSRRGLLQGLGVQDSVVKFMKDKFKCIHHDKYEVKEIVEAKGKGIRMLPVVDDNNRIVRLVNFSQHKSYLPLSAVIMAGGEGIRLRPMTDTVPKPLLHIGDKPIMEYGMMRHGISDVHISINYRGDQIKALYGDGTSRHISISYIEESDKLGTIGSLSLMKEVMHDNVLVMNSDLLTNIDLEEFYMEHESKGADMSVACIPYTVNIPYAILDTDHENVLSFKEKPSITYHSNAGIYLIRKKNLSLIPKNGFFNATDLIEALIAGKQKVIYYPILGYWLDIGKMDDFHKAQEDIKYIKF
jgi:dTDP-glucose pyrophosphorylase